MSELTIEKLSDWVKKQGWLYITDCIYLTPSGVLISFKFQMNADSSLVSIEVLKECHRSKFSGEYSYTKF